MFGRSSMASIDCLWIAGRPGRCRANRSLTGNCYSFSKRRDGRHQPGTCSPRFLYARRDTPEWPLFFDLLNPGNQPWCVNAAVLVLFISKTVNLESGRPITTHSYDTGAAWGNLPSGGHQQPDRARHAGVQFTIAPARCWKCRRNLCLRRWPPSDARDAKKTSPKACRHASTQVVAGRCRNRCSKVNTGMTSS